MNRDLVASNSSSEFAPLVMLALVLSPSKVMPMADSGRSLVDEEWVEVVHEQVGGRCMLSMQGNEVNSFECVNRSAGLQDH